MPIFAAQFIKVYGLLFMVYGIAPLKPKQNLTSLIANRREIQGVAINHKRPLTINLQMIFDILKQCVFNNSFTLKKIFRVMAQGTPTSVQRKDGTQTQKCALVLQELGGKYESSYVATLLGNMASMKFCQNDIVYAVLRFESREYQGSFYMDCVCQDLVKIPTGNAF